MRNSKAARFLQIRNRIPETNWLTDMRPKEGLVSMLAPRTRWRAFAIVLFIVAAAMAVVWPSRWLFLFSRGLWTLVLMIAILIAVYFYDY